MTMGPARRAVGRKFLAAYLTIPIGVKTGKVSLCSCRFKQLGKGSKLPD
jgi:hypothetical protein